MHHSLDAATKSTRTSATATTAVTSNITANRAQSPESMATTLSTPPTPRVHFPAEKEDMAVVKVQRTTPKGIQKGYSSGASSISDESEDKKAEKGHKRDKSDLIRLETMKTSLLTDGNVCTNVVRMETPFGRSIESVYEGVHDGEILGSGISGVVRLVTHRDTGIKYAVKILDLALVKSDEVLEQLRDEIYIMLQLDHPHIVRLEEVYESTNEIYIVQVRSGKRFACYSDSYSNILFPRSFLGRCRNCVKVGISLIGSTFSLITTTRKCSVLCLLRKCCRPYDTFTQEV